MKSPRKCLGDFKSLGLFARGRSFSPIRVPEQPTTTP